MSLALVLATAPILMPLPSGYPDESLESALGVIHKRCFECHSADNAKGGLRLDVIDGWKKSIDVSAPADSELLYRLRLPADDVDAMPPKGDRVAEASSAQLEAWVRSGGDLSPIEAFLARMAASDEGQKAKLAALSRALGASVRPSALTVTQGSMNGLSVNWSHRDGAATTDQVRELQAVANRVVELSFAGTQVTDEIVASLPELLALDRVHLERTRVSDEGVAALLQRAPNLRYLNLHSTAVTGDLLGKVPALGAVQQLVLFGTDAAPQEGPHPFASITGFQPRRLLAVGRADARVVLLREVGLDTYEVLWEHKNPDLDHCLAEWIGATRSEATERRKGIDDGHGRVLVGGQHASVTEFDTRDTSMTGKRGTRAELAMLPGTTKPRTPWAHRGQHQRLSNGHTVMILPWNDRPLPEGAAPRPQLVEKNAAGEIVWTFANTELFPKGIRSVQVIERTP